MIRSTSHPRRQSAAVLLEVLLAVALFVAAAAIATASLNSSIRSLERQRLQTHAVQLASSVLAEVQLGIRSTSGGNSAAQPFENPFQDWTWEIVTDSGPSDFSESNPWNGSKSSSATARNPSSNASPNASRRASPCPPLPPTPSQNNPPEAPAL